MGSFKRRFAGHDAAMRQLRKENPKAARGPAPAKGRRWGQLNHGLSGLLGGRRSQFGRVKGAGGKSGIMSGFKSHDAAALPEQNEKALRRQVAAMDEFYEMGPSGRVLQRGIKDFGIVHGHAEARAAAPKVRLATVSKSLSPEHSCATFLETCQTNHQAS